jgi:D-alanine-D-alanine ligase
MLEAEGYRYTGSPPVSLLVSRNKAMSKKVLAYHGIRVPEFVTYRAGEPIRLPETLRLPLIVKPLQSDASAGIAQASVVQDEVALGERVTLVHERFHQPAIVEEFIDGRELYVSLIGNGDTLDVLPLTEMVFDKKRTRPEERIATQSAKWDEDYRARRGIRNVFARPVSKAVRERIATTCRTAFRVLWLRDYARLDVRLGSDGEVWFLEANANPFISYGHDMANAAEKAGLDYYRFIERLVNEAVWRYERA